LALEFVFTFGINNLVKITPCWRPNTGQELVWPYGKIWAAKIGANAITAKLTAKKLTQTA
jgi:hypothetical protein